MLFVERSNYFGSYFRFAEKLTAAVMSREAGSLLSGHLFGAERGRSGGGISVPARGCSRFPVIERAARLLCRFRRMLDLTAANRFKLYAARNVLNMKKI
ncbi:MAG: hypothetical protein ACOX8R_07225 [Bacillota bacterium]